MEGPPFLDHVPKPIHCPQFTLGKHRAFAVGFGLRCLRLCSVLGKKAKVWRQFHGPVLTVALNGIVNSIEQLNVSKSKCWIEFGRCFFFFNMLNIYIFCGSAWPQWRWFEEEFASAGGQHVSVDVSAAESNLDLGDSK